jgi:uncharacterized membrane protein YbhN (UPF0104 family)
VTRRRLAGTVLGVFGAACAIRFGWTFPWSQTLDLLAHCNWRLLSAAGLINLLSLATKAGVWYVLLRRGTPVRLATAEAATFVGAAVTSMSVSISGDVLRAQLAADRDAVPFRSAAAGLVLSRVVEAVALIGVAALGSLMLPFSSSGRAVGGLLLIFLSGLVIWWSRAPDHWFEAPLGAGWRADLSGLASYSRAGLAPAIGIAMLSWVGQWLTYYWSIRATHVSLSPAAALAALLSANLAGIFRLTPGNIGVMQGSLLVALGAFGVRPGEALAGGLALQGIQVLPVLAIATVLAGASRVRKIGQRRWETL